MVALTFGNRPITLQVGENTGAARRAAAAAQAALSGIEDVRDEVDGLVAGITLPGLLGTTSSLPFITELSSQMELIVVSGGVGYRTTLQVFKKWLGLIPLPVPAGPRALLAGDSRQAGGVAPQTVGATAGMTTGVPMALRLSSIPMWMLHGLNWPMDVIGQWTLGGSKTSETCNDHAMAVMLARRPHYINLVVSTNDAVDFTRVGGLLPIPLGDPDADPATLARVGDRAPSGDGLAAQGTTFGNLDKFIRLMGDPVANGLGWPVVVCLCEFPTENSGRRSTNRAVYLWFKKHVELATYSNLQPASVYPAMLADPAMLDGPVADEVVRTDIEAVVGPLRDSEDKAGFLHQGPPGGRFMGELLSVHPDTVAIFGDMPSRVLVPDGTNDASFVNDNPTVSVGDGSGTLGYISSSSPVPTGVVAEGWALGHNVTTGSIGVVASFDGGEQIVTITRTGGSSATTVRKVELRGPDIAITPVVGDVYVVDAAFEIPGRTTQDVFGVFPHLFFNEPGLVDDYGQDISSGEYGAFGSQNPNYFPKDGDAIISHGVPFEITPAIAASATGTIAMSVRCPIFFSDAMDTATTGALAVKIKWLTLRKYTTDAAHVSPPAVPEPGPEFLTAPSISGSLFVGGTITVNNGTLSGGTITDSRLLRDGVQVATLGGSYDLTSADLGKKFLFENTGTDGDGVVIGYSEPFGPIGTPSAELAALIAALEGVENNAIFDFTTGSVTGTVYRCEDYSGNNNPAIQTATTYHPTTSSTLGAVMDGVDQCAGYTWQTAAPTTVSVIMTAKKDIAANNKRMLSDGTASATNVMLQYTDTGTNALPGTVTVDGVAVTTRDGLYEALNDGLEHTIVATGQNVSAYPALFFGRITGSHQGSIRRGAVIDESTSSLTAARAAGVAWVQASA
ncbi:MAG: hypothetical protein B7X90_01730 [Novosphingobium sp. 17-62-19]|uniref:hypothetical protein n=1 Tax=Novosphingobium sp. 17-62-19 TaxID=1970406 RepID=UPI000BD95042|nr:hypothetical protein [Novosphingobium sp. 17-62-19]OZA21357.1 MAG: hypothetical protein B7X90_01730 [Novosphingobium sp. 17-62-19]HQS95098.1 hypothetical protein [Novosphingobium sp.]